MRKLVCQRFSRALEDRETRRIRKALSRYRTKKLNLGELADVLEELQMTEARKDAGKRLAGELWGMIGGHQRGEVSKQAIVVLFLALIRPPRANSVDGRHRPEPIVPQEETVGTYVRDDRGEETYSLSDKEKQFVYKKYSSRIRCNRLSRSPSRERLQAEGSAEQSFSPRISQRSSAMAETARTKAAIREGMHPPQKIVTLEERMRFNQELYERRKQQRMRRLAQEQLQDCTFHPRINSASRKPSPGRVFESEHSSKMVPPMVTSRFVLTRGIAGRKSCSPPHKGQRSGSAHPCSS